jgi:putative addiction module CopG family antidote
MTSSNLVRKTITLTAVQDDWIKAQVAAGRYTNDSECIRDLIRGEQERNARIEHSKTAENTALNALKVYTSHASDEAPLDPL